MNKALLKEQAYDELKALILAGEFATGSFLSERILADRLGMSKTPIRTALERLEQERFITISPRQGVVVRELTLKEIRDHYDIRVGLECFVVKRLVNRLTDAQFEELDANLETMRCQIEDGNRTYAMYADADFHLLLGSFHGNHEISRVMQHQREKLYHVVTKLLENHPDRIRESLAEHLAVVEALKKGDGELAAVRMLEHLDNGRQLLIEL